MAEKKARPLEDRFPTLYSNISHERPARGSDGSVGDVQTIVTEKEFPPTLRDVVQVVCSAHRITDLDLINDLAASVGQFVYDDDEPEAEQEEQAKLPEKIQ